MTAFKTKSRKPIRTFFMRITLRPTIFPPNNVDFTKGLSADSEEEIMKKKNPTFYSTIVTSKEWCEWERAAPFYGFDWAESTECGWLSPAHWDAFLSWVKGRTKKAKKK